MTTVRGREQWSPECLPLEGTLSFGLLSRKTNIANTMRALRILNFPFKKYIVSTSLPCHTCVSTILP